MNVNQITKIRKKSQKDVQNFIKYWNKVIIPMANKKWDDQRKFNKRTTKQFALLRASLFCFGVSRMISICDEYKMLKRIKDLEYKILEMSNTGNSEKDLEDLIDEIEEHETDI